MTLMNSLAELSSENIENSQVAVNCEFDCFLLNVNEIFDGNLCKPVFIVELKSSKICVSLKAPLFKLYCSE
jgi:hypothetical protein